MLLAALLSATQVVRISHVCQHAKTPIRKETLKNRH